MPAAAVIPAPRMNIHAVAVKKLVAEFKCWAAHRVSKRVCVLLVFCEGVAGFVCVIKQIDFSPKCTVGLPLKRKKRSPFTVSKSECSKQAFRLLNVLHGMIRYDLRSFGLFGAQLIINRSGWRCLNSEARGEILGFSDDKQKRKHSASTSPLVKNESWGIQDD